MPKRTPIVGVTCCIKHCPEQRPYHGVGMKYVEAVISAVGAVPLLIPAEGTLSDLPQWLARLDGLLITGSVSNIEPYHYDAKPVPTNTCFDPARDSLTLPLIRRALDENMPVLGICRGMQELNVALGGTLHQEMKDVPGFMSHAATVDVDHYSKKYDVAHAVDFTPGGMLEKITGRKKTMVNSLHHQGIRELGRGLSVEARAPDGAIEAVSLDSAKEGFVVGVQWHPEWLLPDDDASRCLFRAFGRAVA